MSEYVKSKIRSIDDFPKPGIVFRDITTALKDAEALKRTVDFLSNEFADVPIDYIIGIESRGFIYGSAIAYKLDAGLVLIRKPNKLPAKTVSQSYELEYGTDTLEMHEDAIEPGKNVLIIDDLLATGGTVNAAIQLVQKSGANIVGCAFVIELEDLKGRNRLPVGLKTISMLKY